MIFLGLIVIRYLFYRPCPFNSNIASLAKPTKANDGFAKGMTFYLILTLNYSFKSANRQR
jgi:hypothetical protein